MSWRLKTTMRVGDVPIQVDLVDWDLRLYGASSFPDEDTYRACYSAIVIDNKDTVVAWLDTDAPRCVPLRTTFDHVVGFVVDRDGEREVRGATLVLVRDDQGTPQVHTCHPEPPLPPAPDLPGLELLLGSWFHADWVDDGYDGPESVISEFFASNAGRFAIGDEIAVLRGLPDEAARRSAVRGLGSYFVPEPPGQVDALLDWVERLHR